MERTGIGGAWGATRSVSDGAHATQVGSPKHRKRRERKAQAGQMVLLDGSEHDCSRDEVASSTSRNGATLRTRPMLELEVGIKQML